jgi:hypothetical protein
LDGVNLPCESATVSHFGSRTILLLPFLEGGLFGSIRQMIAKFSSAKRSEDFHSLYFDLTEQNRLAIKQLIFTSIWFISNFTISSDHFNSTLL